MYFIVLIFVCISLFYDFHKNNLCKTIFFLDMGEVWVWGYGFLGKGPKLTDTAIPECIDMNLFGRAPGKADVAVKKVWCGLHYFAAITSKYSIFR